jgi:hypothetical protein
MAGQQKPLGTPQDADVIVPNDQDSASYVKGLVERGEAVRLEPGTALPPKATHEIIGETEAGLPIVRRKRYSAF